MEYGLNGVVPDNLKPVTKGMFALMRPVIDNNNVRFENGSKGGRKPRAPQKPAPSPDYSLSFEQEIEQMKADADWSATICEDYRITTQEYADRLKRFLKHCKASRKTKPHDSFDDAKSHLRYWMDKAFPRSIQPLPPAEDFDNNPLQPPTSDYSFNGGFGGMDI